jgi:hypothetical protein
MVSLALVTAAALAVFGDELTPPLTLIGALVVAIITAEAADVRQGRQIAADADRQARELEAERLRHTATLEQNRELADLADLRSILDDAAIALHKGDDAIGGVKVAYTQFGRAMHEREPEARRMLNALGQELDVVVARLAVRLGPADDGVRAARGAADHALDVSRAVGWLEDDRPQETQKKHERIDRGREEYKQAADRFMNAAVELAGTRRS